MTIDLFLSLGLPRTGTRPPATFFVISWQCRSICNSLDGSRTSNQIPAKIATLSFGRNTASPWVTLLTRRFKKDEMRESNYTIKYKFQGFCLPALIHPPVKNIRANKLTYHSLAERREAVFVEAHGLEIRQSLLPCSFSAASSSRAQ